MLYLDYRHQERVPAPRHRAGGARGRRHWRYLFQRRARAFRSHLFWIRLRGQRALRWLRRDLQEARQRYADRRDQPPDGDLRPDGGQPLHRRRRRHQRPAEGHRPLRLFDEDKINLYIETERYDPYFATIKQLLPDLTEFLPIGDSFIADFMLLDSMQLKALRKAADVDYSSWKKICDDNTPNQRDSASAFSEYETIGTWMLNHAPDKINLVKSDTYGMNKKYRSKHKLTDLLKINSVIPLRLVYDCDINWYE